MEIHVSQSLVRMAVLSRVFQHIPMQTKGYPASTFKPASDAKVVLELHFNPDSDFFMTGFCASDVSGTPRTMDSVRARNARRSD